MCARRNTEEAVARIYEAATDPDLWKEALEESARLLSASAMLLVYGDRRGGGTRVLGSVGFRQSSIEGPGGESFLESDFVRDSMAGSTGVVLSSGRSRRSKPLLSTDTYRYLLKPNGYAHFAGAAVLAKGDAHASVWMARKEGALDFSKNDLDTFIELLPHVARATTVHHRICRAELEAEMAVGAFDRFAVGIVLLDVLGTPVMVNREANRIASAEDGFIIRQHGISAADSSQTKALRELVGRVGWTGPAGERSGGGAVRLSRPSGDPDYHVVVLPLPSRCQPAGVDGAVEVLFITDTERSTGPIEVFFGDLYGLTDAETRLVAELLEGSGLTAAAEKLGVSRNTVHSQLSSIFQKTGTKRQGELLRLLLSGVAPVEPPGVDSGFDLPVTKLPPNRSR